MTKLDRRVQRTRARLQTALIDLIDEHGYDSITIQDIVDRADIARTTFYLHYKSKDDLFMSCHEAIVNEFQFVPLYPHPLSREELLSAYAPSGMTSAYQHLKAAWGRLHPIFQGKDGSLLLKRIRNWSAKEIEANLRAAFSDCDTHIPYELLANYLAGAQLALVHWWLEKRRSYTAADLAQTFHRLQRAAIRDAFGLTDPT